VLVTDLGLSPPSGFLKFIVRGLYRPKSSLRGLTYFPKLFAASGREPCQVLVQALVKLLFSGFDLVALNFLKSLRARTPGLLAFPRSQPEI